MSHLDFYYVQIVPILKAIKNQLAVIIAKMPFQYKSNKEAIVRTVLLQSEELSYRLNINAQ